MTDHGQQHDQGDTLRAAQIQAVREVIVRTGITPALDSAPGALLRVTSTGGTAAFAGQLVDAVLAAGGLCGQTSESLLLGHPPLVCTMPAGHVGQWHGDDNGSRWTPQMPTPEWERKLIEAQQQRDDQAEARGYAAAVAELRGVVQRTGSPAARWAAGYLEAVGPGPYGSQSVPDGPTHATPPTPPRSAADGPTQGEVTTQGRTGADGHTAGVAAPQVAGCTGAEWRPAGWWQRLRHRERNEAKR